MRLTHTACSLLAVATVGGLLLLSAGFATAPAEDLPETIDVAELLETDPGWFYRVHAGIAPPEADPADPAAVPAPETGTIRGSLDSPFARRYPAAVYIDTIEGGQFDAPATNPVMDQVNLRFTPHVLAVLEGSTIDFPNSDQVRHNVYTTKSAACQFNLGTYAEGMSKSVTCDNLGVITLLCNVHAEMSGYIVVAPTPYFATTDSAGEFLIEGVPAGTYSLTFWHQRLASQTVEVTVQANAEVQVEFSGLKRK